jgi:hypothetical protein
METAKRRGHAPTPPSARRVARSQGRILLGDQIVGARRHKMIIHHRAGMPPASLIQPCGDEPD